MTQKNELLVYLSHSESACIDCKEPIEKNEFVTLKRPNKETICLTCSDLDHLVFLPSGDTALTRRARKHSSLSVVVVSFSKARKRNERQGVLVSADGLALAEEECLSDEEIRVKQREKARERETLKDAQYVEDFASEIRKFYPGCPEQTAVAIAEHSCQKYSGRVGRAAGAKKLEGSFVNLAVRAHIRHTETNYDELLYKYGDRQLAREMVSEKIDSCVSRWSKE